MTTKPIDDLFSKNLPVEVQTVLDKLSGAIEETVNFGTHVFNWCTNSGVHGIEHAPVFLSFRHILELLDSISILVKSSSIEPSFLLLRAVFESSLNIEYLLQGNLKIRGRDFLFWHQQDRLKLLKRIQNDKRSKLPYTTILVSNEKKLEEDIEFLEKVLDHPKFTDSKKEYVQYKNPSNWFNLHNGPRNIEELADKLGKKDRYIILYKQWSKLVHGIDIFKGKYSKAKDGGTYFTQLRLPQNCEKVTSFSISFALEIYQIMVRNYAKKNIRCLAEWYKHEIKDLYVALSEHDLIKVI